jgi:hypothetical protein
VANVKVVSQFSHVVSDFYRSWASLVVQVHASVAQPSPKRCEASSTQPVSWFTAGDAKRNAAVASDLACRAVRRSNSKSKLLSDCCSERKDLFSNPPTLHAMLLSVVLHEFSVRIDLAIFGSAAPLHRFEWLRSAFDESEALCKAKKTNRDENRRLTEPKVLQIMVLKHCQIFNVLKHYNL